MRAAFFLVDPAASADAARSMSQTSPCGYIEHVLRTRAKIASAFVRNRDHKVTPREPGRREA